MSLSVVPFASLPLLSLVLSHTHILPLTVSLSLSLTPLSHSHLAPRSLTNISLCLTIVLSQY